jgi:hypothetical protein
MRSSLFWGVMIYMIYLLTAIGLSPGGSTHLHTNNTQNNTNNKRTTQITTNVEECGPCPIFASFTLAFASQLRKKHGKPSVRVRKTSVRLRKTSVREQYTYYQKHPHKHTHTHTLQNNILCKVDWLVTEVSGQPMCSIVPWEPITTHTITYITAYHNAPSILDGLLGPWRWDR